MSYLGFGLIITLISVFIISFILLSFFEKIMNYMKEQSFGIGRYEDSRIWWIIGLTALFLFLSLFAWPIILVFWGVFSMYIYIRKNDKFKRIIEIINESPNKKI